MSTVWTADLFPIRREIEGIVFPGAAGTETYGENGCRDSRDGGGNGSDNSNLFDHCFFLPFWGCNPYPSSVYPGNVKIMGSAWKLSVKPAGKMMNFRLDGTPSLSKKSFLSIFGVLRTLRYQW